LTSVVAGGKSVFESNTGSSSDGTLSMVVGEFLNKGSKVERLLQVSDVFSGGK